MSSFSLKPMLLKNILYLMCLFYIFLEWELGGSNATKLCGSPFVGKPFVDFHIFIEYNTLALFYLSGFRR